MHNASTLHAGKEVLVQNMKSRINLLETYAITHQGQEDEINTLQKHVKELKGETGRKHELINQLKTRIASLENEIKAGKLKPTSTLGIQALSTLQAHLKNTKQKTKDMEGYLARYSAREKQFIHVLEKVIEAFTHKSASEREKLILSEGSGDVDPDIVQEMAQKISVQVTLTNTSTLKWIGTKSWRSLKGQQKGIL
jgi:septal ring factor EnvC (AmiA/AmiB activator)